MRIVQASSLIAVERILRENKLPIEDLFALLPSDFLYCGPTDSPLGVIGLQVVDSVGLLRSLVVTDAGRNKGYGTALVAALETKALQAGITDLYLLTETAQMFFEKLNYTKIARASAPLSIKNTAEFDGLCPADAALMYKQLMIID